MGVNDGRVRNVHQTIQGTSDAWSLVLVAEGYRSSELWQFQIDVGALVDYLRTTAPFDDAFTQQAINVYSLEVESTESGADDLRNNNNLYQDTYFDAAFGANGIDRRITADTTLLEQEVTSAVPDWDTIVLIVNSAIEGGTAITGVAAMVSTAYFNWEAVALHELGHAAFGLRDEYDYLIGPNLDKPGHDIYTGVEPAAANVTTKCARADIKWNHHIGPSIPMPTTSNNNCSVCDPQPNPYSSNTIGAYEGAYHYHCAVYRPAFDCIMRSIRTSSEFCVVCQDKIRADISPVASQVSP